MTMTATITHLYPAQTPSSHVAMTTPRRYDAVLQTATAAISYNDAPYNVPAATQADDLAAAEDALCAFLNDPMTHDHVLIRELATALAKMMSTDPLPHSESSRAANAVNRLSMRSDLPSVADWNGRERQARHTASLMFALIQQRERLDRLAQESAGAAARH